MQYIFIRFREYIISISRFTRDKTVKLKLNIWRAVHFKITTKVTYWHHDIKHYFVLGVFTYCSMCTCFWSVTMQGWSSTFSSRTLFFEIMALNFLIHSVSDSNAWVGFRYVLINTLRSGQNGRRHFQVHSLEWKIWISNKISLKYIPYCLIDNMGSLVQIMAWHWTGANH